MVSSTVPIDKGWAWIIGIGIFVQNMIMLGILKCFGIFLVEFIKEFDASSTLGSSIMGIQCLTYAFSATISLHILTSIFTNRQVMLFGSVMASLGIGLGFFAQNITFLLFTYGSLIGLGNACLYGPSLVMIGKYFEKRRGLVTGVAIAGGSVGQFTMPPIVRLLFDNYGLRGGLLLLSGIMFQCAITSSLIRPTSYYTLGQSKSASSHLGLCCVKKMSKKREQLEHLDSSGIRKADSAEGSDKWNFKNIIDLSLFKSLKYIMLLSSTCFGVVGAIFVAFYIPGHANDLGINEQDVVWLMTIVGGADLIGRIACGALADSGFMQRYNILVLSFLLNGILAIMVPLFTEFWHLTIFCTVYGLLGSFYFSLISLVLTDLFGLEKLPKTLGVLFFFEAIANSIAPFILGSLRDTTGNYLASFYYMGGTSIMAALILFSIRFVKQTTIPTDYATEMSDMNNKDKCERLLEPL